VSCAGVPDPAATDEPRSAGSDHSHPHALAPIRLGIESISSDDREQLPQRRAHPARLSALGCPRAGRRIPPAVLRPGRHAARDALGRPRAGAGATVHPASAIRHRRAPARPMCALGLCAAAWRSARCRQRTPPAAGCKGCFAQLSHTPHTASAVALAPLCHPPAPRCRQPPPVHHRRPRRAAPPRAAAHRCAGGRGPAPRGWRCP
jgi:hypothetical protein